MKKFFKGIILGCLMLVMLCPLALVGCAKKYTINIVIAQGEGNVIEYKDLETGKSVKGKNAVEKGSRFEFTISPLGGYEVEKILVDGEEIAVTKTVLLDNIDKNHEIEIYFKRQTFHVTFMCRDGDNHVEYAALSCDISYGDSIDLNQAKFGGANNKNWYDLDTGKYYYNNKTNKDDLPDNPNNVNIVGVRNNLVIYTDLTKAELDAFQNA